MRVRVASLVTWFKSANQLGIRGRLVSAFVGVASLTLLASVVAFFSYSYIGRNLHHIETEGIPVMNRALTFARQAAEYSMIASELRAADDKTALLTIVKQLRAKREEMSATLDALTELRLSADSLMSSTDEVAAAIDLRLSANARRKELVESALAAHRAIVEKLAPLLDDASFDLTIGLESLGHVRTREATRFVERAQTDASVFQNLSDVRAEGQIALGILEEVSLSPSASLLTPLRDRFTAASDRARKALAAVEKVKEGRELQSAFERLLGLGGSRNDLFQARRTELEAISESWRLVSASQSKAALLATQVQRLVRDAEEASSAAVSGARRAIAQSQSLLIALAIVSLGSAIVFAWLYVGRGLLVRLGELNDAILALAGGNLETEIPHGGHDELTRIATAVEVFKRNAIEARELEADKERGRIADLKQRESSFRLLFQSNPVPMWVYDRKSLRFLSVNDAAVSLYGYGREQFLSMTIFDIRPREARDALAQFLRGSDGNSKGKEVWQHLKADGSVFDVVVYSCVLPYHGADATLVAIIDITERKRAEARITHMAHHDALTDLANRVLFRERLDRALMRDRRNNKGVAVLALDLDRFKEVNDTLGHPIGDALLKGVAQRLRDCVRETDTIARLGGDEFAVVQSVMDEASETAALAQRLQEAITEPYDLDGHHVVIGTSIGIAVSPADGTDPDDLLKNADLALYRAKSEGCGAYHFFEPEMDRRMRARRNLERDLRNALTNGEFALHYQPLVNIERDEICGFEALLRWTHPERGKVSPADFIPLAEETGLIVPIGEWVLRQACKDAAIWPDHLRIAVNVSVAQFKSRNLVALVVNTLAATGLLPRRLELEITESVMLQDEEGALEILTRLHDLGVRIALDDFGTGYSSLSNLRKFHFDKIKIDRSFVSDLSAANVDALAVVRSIAQLGVSLGMSTTAEGVETQEQMDQVRAEGCTEMQGFLFSRAVPADEITRLLVTKSHEPATAA
jgi:diguanylate cyclase (GGDEF)-like protein/PAS domain S-box-containing protein